MLNPYKPPTVVTSVIKPPDPSENTQLCLASYRTYLWLTVLNENTLMLRPGARTHQDLDILNARSLAGRPMNTGGSSARGYSSQIEDQIANLPEEDVRRYPTLVTVALILIAVYQTKSCESWSSFDDRERVWIANNLRKVVINDRRRDYICAGREVDNRRGCS